MEAVRILAGIDHDGENRCESAFGALAACRYPRSGWPCYAQFDNGRVFQGHHQWSDCFVRVTRLCLILGVVPVFTPPREVGPGHDRELQWPLADQ